MADLKSQRERNARYILEKAARFKASDREFDDKAPGDAKTDSVSVDGSEFFFKPDTAALLGWRLD